VPFARGPRTFDPGRISFQIAKRTRELGLLNQFGEPNVEKIHQATQISTNTVTRLLRTPETVQTLTVDTLARLCQFLECQPGDLIVHERACVPLRRRRAS
jgi:DNA-binding Xre family transcriptional regulator